MNLKNACYLAMILVIGSFIIGTLSHLLGYYPVFKNAPDQVMRIMLISFVPYRALAFVSTAGFVIFLVSLPLREKDSRAGKTGLSVAAVLLALTTLANLGLSLFHITRMFEHIHGPQVFFYVATSAAGLISELLLCLFVAMLISDTARPAALAVINIVAAILFTIVVGVNIIINFNQAPDQEQIWYTLASVLSGFGVLLHTGAIILPMAAYIKHTQKSDPSPADSALIFEPQQQPM